MSLSKDCRCPGEGTLRMDGREFYRRIDEDEHLAWLGVRQGAKSEDDIVLIMHDGFGSWQASKFELRISAIGKHDWDELWSVLTGERAAKIMSHMSRIVGYYSNMRNWNKSKLAENRDRQRGHYGIPEPGGDGNVEASSKEQAAHASPGEPARV